VEEERRGRGRKKSDDVIDFKATLREVNCLGEVCVCIVCLAYELYSANHGGKLLTLLTSV